MTMRSGWVVLLGLGLGCGGGDAPWYPILQGGGGETPEVDARDDFVIADHRPPPLSGGTLLLADEGRLAVAADPDRDRVSLADFEGGAPRHVALLEGDEPGRAIEAGGLIHVALRGAGDLVSIDPGTATVVGRRPICSAPRGLVHEPIADEIYVACADGELVAVSPDPSSSERRRMVLDRDLRDVVLFDAGLLVSRFRSAEVLYVDFDGTIRGRLTPRPFLHPNGTRFLANVAWRLESIPGGGAVMVHQRARQNAIVLDPEDSPNPSYTARNCGDALSHAAVTVFHPGVMDNPSTLSGAGGLHTMGLPVDIAVSPDGATAVVVSAAHRRVAEASLETFEHEDDCAEPNTGNHLRRDLDGEVVAARLRPTGEIVMQQRDPPRLVIQTEGDLFGTWINLPGDTILDTGHELFHQPPSPRAEACATCHPEGRDDGHVWSFAGLGPRRTQTLDHDLAATAPFHWDGALDDMRGLVDEVYVHRLGGEPQGEHRVAALASWLDTLRRIPARLPTDLEAVERGGALYESLGCATCHGGPALTNNTNAAVGKGVPTQVPSLLGIADRAPFMHDGCASTLRDRFGPCGGGDLHGETSTLSEAEIDDLVAYMETL
ncbi:MAG: c-type cytochrome [Polyangiaceae bacterium]